jgi:ribosome-associated protein
MSKNSIKFWGDSGDTENRLDRSWAEKDGQTMNIESLRKEIEEKGEVSFSRSSGPGGQNVNKVSTKVLLRLRLSDLVSLSEFDRGRLFAKLQNKLTLEGELVLQVQEERSQLLNREIAVERMLALLLKALHRELPRRDTRPTKASRERRLSTKKIHSLHKRNREVRED